MMRMPLRVSPRHDGLPEWPAFELARRATMHLDVESRVFSDLDAETQQLWSGTDY